MKQTAKFLVTAAVAFSTSFLGSTTFAQHGQRPSLNTNFGRSESSTGNTEPTQTTASRSAILFSALASVLTSRKRKHEVRWPRIGLPAMSQVR